MNEVAAASRAGSRMGFTTGVITIVLGVLAILAPQIGGKVINVLVSAALIGAGIAQLVFTFKSKSFGEGFLRFLFGGLTAVAGLFMLANPAVGLASLTIIVGSYLIASGLSSVIFAFQVRPMRGWGWMIFDGVIAFLLAFMILRDWPFSGDWVIGTLLGAHLIVRGMYFLMFGSVGEEMSEAIEQSAM